MHVIVYIHSNQNYFHAGSPTAARGGVAQMKDCADRSPESGPLTYKQISIH